MLSAMDHLQKNLVPSLIMYGKKREGREINTDSRKLQSHNNEVQLFKENSEIIISHNL